MHEFLDALIIFIPIIIVHIFSKNKDIPPITNSITLKLPVQLHLYVSSYGGIFGIS